MNLHAKILETTAFLNDKISTDIDTAFILGTGLGGLVNELKNSFTIPYSSIPNFPGSTVDFHKGQLHVGNLAGKSVILMEGRSHFYEGSSMRDIGVPIWVFKALGVKHLIISGAAGGMNLAWSKGDLMMLNDHINLLPDNPLIGPNDERIGTRFPDMSAPYSSQLNSDLKAAADKHGIVLREGVYVAAQGPMLETAAEYAFLRKIGADAVGMSTVPEVIVANHCGLPCSAIVVLTDECDPQNLQPIDIPELLKIAGAADKELVKLFKTFISQN